MPRFRIEVTKTVELTFDVDSHEEAEMMAEEVAAHDDFGSEQEWKIGPAEEIAF